MSNLLEYVRYIHRQYIIPGHTLKTIVTSAQFTTERIVKYMEENQIRLEQPPPHDHGQNGNGESIVKIMQDGMNKQLFGIGKNNQHNKKLWAPQDGFTAEFSAFKAHMKKARARVPAADGEEMTFKYY